MQLCPNEVFAAAGAFAERSMELYNSIDGAAFRNQYFAEGCEVTRKLCDARRGRRHLERKIRKANMGKHVDPLYFVLFI